MDFVSISLSSNQWYARASKVLPAGVSYSTTHMSSYPVYIKRASGVRVYDADGNEYLDFWTGHGALLLGHAYPPVAEAVQDQVALGAHFGYCHEWEVLLAEQIVDILPSAEMVRYTDSGAEANMCATRLARAVTKRSKIAKYEGGWHGGYDALHKAVPPLWRLWRPQGTLKQVGRRAGRQPSPHSSTCATPLKPSLATAAKTPTGFDGRVTK